MLHFRHIFPKVVHFSRNRVLFLYVFEYKSAMNIMRVIICVIVLCFQAIIFQAAAQKDSGSSIISAVQYVQDGEYDKARGVLQGVISSDPTSDAAWYYLGLCYVGKLDADMAEECFQKAVELDASNFWYRHRLAAIYRATNRQELTIDIYEKLLLDFPNKSDLYFDLVELYVSQGEYEKALDTIKEIEKEFGITENLAIYRFRLLLQLNQTEQAYASLHEYNRKYSSPYVLAALADQYLSDYKDSLALSLYDEALEIAPDFPPAVLGKAETLRITSRYDEYFNVLNDYVALSSETPDSKMDYLSAVLQKSDPKFVNRYQKNFDVVVERAMDAHPCDSSVLSLVGLYYYATDRVLEATEVFKKNLLEHKESKTANIIYAESLMYAGKWEDLSKASREALDIFPGEFTLLETALIADRTLGRNDAALELCDNVLKTNPKDTSVVLSIYSTMGDIYYEINEPARAAKAYDKALKYKPDYLYVLNNYAYFLCEDGKKLKKAYEMSRKTLEASPDDMTYLDTFGWILYKMKKPEEAVKHFKKAMLYGGKDNPVILDHYAEVLFALKEYDKAMVYWNKALLNNNGRIKDLEERVELRKQQWKNSK